MSSRLAVPGTASSILSVLLIAALLYVAPARYDGVLGIGREGADVFCTALFGRAFPPLLPHQFNTTFRALLILSWLSWIVAVAGAHRGMPIARRELTFTAGALVVLVAIAMPPVLSRDAFGYVAYASVAAHDLNPYTHGTGAALQAVDDPLARFLFRDTPLGYGPLWTLTAIGLNALTSGALFAQAMAHKVLAALALLAIAAGAARLADSARRAIGQVTVLAVVLNPLLLVEGPGMGHNDVLMMALIVWSAVMCRSERWLTAALLVGLAGAIKPVAFTAVPLVAFEYLVRSRQPWSSKSLLSILSLVFLTFAPFVAASYCFGGPAVVLRATSGQLNPGRGGTIVFAFALGLALAWSILTIWKARREAAPAWLVAWIAVAAALVIFGTQHRFPWYAIWLLVPALTGWTERHRILITTAATLAILMSWLYTIDI